MMKRNTARVANAFIYGYTAELEGIEIHADAHYGSN